VLKSAIRLREKKWRWAIWQSWEVGYNYVRLKQWHKIDLWQTT